MATTDTTTTAKSVRLFLLLHNTQLTVSSNVPSPAATLIADSARETLNPVTRVEKGNPFASPIFTILVSADTATMHAHQTVLSRSPVLEAMCSANFKEGTERRINLSEDSEEDVKVLLEYLYSSKMATIPKNQRGDEYSHFLARMYILGDKYQLPGLKEKAFNKLKPLTAKNSAEVFFEVVKKIYDNTPDSDEYFRPFFRLFMHRFGNRVENKRVQDLIVQGGQLALDIYLAQGKKAASLPAKIAEEKMLKPVYEGARHALKEGRWLVARDNNMDGCHADKLLESFAENKL